MCEGGEVARCAIWENELLEMYYQKSLHRVRPYEGVAAEWLALVLEYLASTSSLGTSRQEAPLIIFRKKI